MARFIFPNHLRLSMSSALVALLLVAILLTGRTAPAQGTTGSITGTVTDASGAAVPAATVWQVPCLRRKGRLQSLRAERHHAGDQPDRSNQRTTPSWLHPGSRHGDERKPDHPDRHLVGRFGYRQSDDPGNASQWSH